MGVSGRTARDTLESSEESENAALFHPKTIWTRSPRLGEPLDGWPAGDATKCRFAMER